MTRLTAAAMNQLIGLASDFIWVFWVEFHFFDRESGSWLDWEIKMAGEFTPSVDIGW